NELNDNLRAQVKNSQETLATTIEQLRIAKTELEAAKSELGTQASAYQTAKSEFDASQVELAAIKSELDTANSELNKTRSELEVAKSELDAAKSQLRTTQSDLDKSHEELDNSQQKFHTVESELASSTSGLQAAQTDLEKAQEQLKTATAELESAQSKTSELERQSAQAQNELKDLRSTHAKLQKQIQDEHEKSQQAQESLKSQLQTTRENHKKSLQEIRADYNQNLQSTRDEHNGALQTLRDKLAEVRQERNDRVRELQTQLRETQRQLGTLDARDIDPREHNTAEAMDAFFAEPAEVERYEEFGDSLQALLKSHRVTLNKKKVMDAGVGPGYALAEVMKRYAPRSVHGIDYSEVAISSCRELMPEGQFTVGSLYEPLPESYDVVLCTEVLEHLDNPEAAVDRILESLSPGGTAVFTVPDGRVDVSRLHLNFWSPESWERFMRTRTNGFRLTIDAFQARDSSRYQNNVAIVTKPGKKAPTRASSYKGKASS
ncbi:methyltransferase domain-containing protein, partial [Agrococcus casei]|uniref:class I SAM-dependent methyltransferase n=1 Tax=Agrococcus casei TaxID=343512 RepID=UPI003F8E2D9F